jgi:tetratricopeptide (TPR) repeat protein
MKRTEFIMMILAFGSFSFNLAAQDHSAVKIWEDSLSIPTYKVNPPDPLPIFFSPNRYQGASGVIYPYPIQDNLTHEKIIKQYKTLYLENEYIKLCILPELGGRLFYATDKTNGYEIFYRQHVIKPALIGMLGAWISGGIEFCVFHHHRASTYLPVDYRLTENDDGSKTIWIGEYEPRHRMKWTIGITLYPQKSYIELSGTLMNTTENYNSFLYWANVATHVNDRYRIIFPPSTQFATYHAKNWFAHWPITTETYVGYDYYQDSIDASWWKNHPRQVSFFAHDLKEGFLAGYDYGKQAGTMHVANPHIVKGAKLWEWGPGPEGSMWDTKVLTDSDGPYAELMTGAYSDNQPDYSWIKPYEVKIFKEYWYPLRETEGVKAANLDATLNLEIEEDNNIFIAANTTNEFNNARIILEHSGEIIFEKTIKINPSTPFSHMVASTGEIKKQDLKLSLLSGNNEEIISYQPKIYPYQKDLPETVKPPEEPEDINSNEELYYTGLRIRQFHNSLLNQEDYFLEALKRDSLDVRCNNIMGIIHMQKGEYEVAKKHFRNAISRITKNYTRPRDCEPLYHLGVLLQKQGHYESAIDTLYRAAWDHEFSSPAYFHIAQIYSIRHQYDLALDALNHSLNTNAMNINALCLKTSLLRLTGESEMAIRTANQILEIDRMNQYAGNELQLLFDQLNNINERNQYQALLIQLLRDYPENYLELAVCYMNSGLYPDAIKLLEMTQNSENEKLKNYPSIYYYSGYLYHMTGDPGQARKNFEKGMKLPVDYCFPFRLESVSVYEAALSYHKDDSRAHYYLGNLLYDKQPGMAISHWEQAVRIEPDLSIAHRNLGWGYNDHQNDIDKAIASYEQAIKLDRTKPRYYSEIDQLYERGGVEIEKRLKLFTENHEYVEQYQVALVREIELLVLAGEYDRAIEYLDGRYFHRQEGSAGLHDLHVNAHLLKGKQYLEKGQAEKALEHFLTADTYPENHLIGRDSSYDANPQIYYYTGLACEKKGDSPVAMEYFKKAYKQENVRTDYQYYQALAYRKAGFSEKADQILDGMIQSGLEQLESKDNVDFFAKFGTGLTEEQRKANAYYILGLGYLGKADMKKARDSFTVAHNLNTNQLWPKIYLEDL